MTKSEPKFKVGDYVNLLAQGKPYCSLLIIEVLKVKGKDEWFYKTVPRGSIAIGTDENMVLEVTNHD